LVSDWSSDVCSSDLDAEGVPLADRLVGHLGGVLGVLLVVEQAARADLVVPDLHLWVAAEVDAAVAPLADLPIDPQLEVAVVLGRSEERRVGEGREVR